ncbi:MAG: TIGR04255 family protein [Sulfurovum sp.]|nr:TIGR04255 family protein [Sulfurovum sp.]
MKAPIIDAVFDIWFESKMPSEALLGIIVENIESYKKIQSLPLLQLPRDIRLTEPNLKHQALYEILSIDEKPYKIVLGHNSLGIALNGKYQGWDKSFFPEIKKIYKKIFDKGLIEKITRCGLRYVDFFQDENIYQTGKVSVTINNVADTTQKILLRIEKEIDNNIAMAVVIDNKAIVKKSSENTEQNGSIIDIASFVKNEEFLNDKNFFETVGKLHAINKGYFEEVANDKLIKQLGI